MYCENDLSSCAVEYFKENEFDRHFLCETIDTVISVLNSRSRWKYGSETRCEQGTKRTSFTKLTGV